MFGYFSFDIVLPFHNIEKIHSCSSAKKKIVKLKTTFVLQHFLFDSFVKDIFCDICIVLLAGKFLEICFQHATFRNIVRFFMQKIFWLNKIPVQIFFDNDVFIRKLLSTKFFSPSFIYIVWEMDAFNKINFWKTVEKRTSSFKKIKLKKLKH